MSNSSDLNSLQHNEERALEQAKACDDISGRIAHLARAAGYAKMIKALKS